STPPWSSTPRLHSPPSPELAYVVLGGRTPIRGHPPLARSHIRRQAAPQGARDPPLPHRATPAAATPPRPNPSLIGQLEGKETGQWDMLGATFFFKIKEMFPASATAHSHVFTVFSSKADHK
ncbi:unnamed protein product, partial [Urochloa humidicola]